TDPVVRRRGGSRPRQHPVAPPAGTVALSEGHDPSTLIGQHLNLDVSGLEKVALQVDPFVPERGFRFGLSGLERPDKLLLLVHDPHPAPTPAGTRLDDHGKPNLASGFERLALAAKLAGAAGKNRNSAAPQDLPRLRLVPEHRDVLGGRAD